MGSLKSLLENNYCFLKLTLDDNYGLLKSLSKAQLWASKITLRSTIMAF